MVPDSTISTTERASGFGQHSLPFDRLPARIRPPNLTTARLCTSFSRPPRYPLSPAVPPSPRRVAHTSHTLPALTASLPSRASHYLALGHPPPVRVQTVPRARRRVKGDYGSTKFLRRRRVSYEFQAAHQSIERVCSQPLSSCNPRRLNPSSPWTARPETSPPHHLTTSLRQSTDPFASPMGVLHDTSRACAGCGGPNYVECILPARTRATSASR